MPMPLRVLSVKKNVSVVQRPFKNDDLQASWVGSAMTSESHEVP